MKTFSDDNDTAETIPSGNFLSQEIIEDNEGDISPGTRPIGTNKVGMVAWVVNIKTPEYSKGRNIGFEYLYLTDEDYAELAEGTMNAHKVTEGREIDDIIGTNHVIGVENLQGSGMIAGETSRAYNEIFTLSCVTGRSVGIGAYLVRLGQRVIQMKQDPMLLTGFSALNKLLGKEVYNSKDQIGGHQIMFPNGVSHEIIENNQEGVPPMWFRHLQWVDL